MQVGKRELTAPQDTQGNLQLQKKQITESQTQILHSEVLKELPALISFFVPKDSVPGDVIH